MTDAVELTVVYQSCNTVIRRSTKKNLFAVEVASDRVVEMIPVRFVEPVSAFVVEMIPVLVVEMIPALVVEMIPVLVVEIMPVFANTGTDIVTTKIPAQRRG